MTALMAFPFSLDPQGHVVTLEDTSDDYMAGELALITLVRPGERELVPTYGTGDPAFSSFDKVEFLSQVALFGPPVVINSIEQSYVHPGRLVVSIDFDSVDRFSGSGFFNPDEET